LRTAEKLYEELLIGSNVTGTEHPRIMRAMTCLAEAVREYVWIRRAAMLQRGDSKVAIFPRRRATDQARDREGGDAHN
jgi:FlaA1/EpsC-like NDP-sugar epimerase